jgi:outer membrane protein assembly factor BamB
VGSDDGHLYGPDRETGALVWKYLTGDAIAAGPTVVDDRLYVGSIDRRLYAFNLRAE